MLVTYTNCKGRTYVLCRGTTATGKPRYFFARELNGEAVEALPDGYHIEESVNGVLSLAKDRSQRIRPEEQAAVEEALKRHLQSDQYRLRIKDNQIVVYERQGPDIEALMARFGRVGPPRPQIADILNRSAHYIPVMQFVLHDDEERVFTVERWHFSGSIDDWIDIGHAGQIGTLARALIPLLGTERFFDL